MGAAAGKSGMEAAWGRGCRELRGHGEGTAYAGATDPEEEGGTRKADREALAQPVSPGEGQE